MSQTPTDPTRPANQEPGLDAAQQSLSDALGVSFFILKIVMVFLAGAYLVSGTIIVEEGETAVRYRFGKQVGTYGPGWHFGLPFPIEDQINVPTKTQVLQLNESFWYDNPDDKKPEELAFQQLNPLNDSFLITGDTNVIHVQFIVNYAIDNGRVDDYLKNVGTLDRANELVKTAAERGMIHYVASATVEKIILGQFQTDTIESFTQRMLNDLGAGINIQDVLIDGKNQSMPNQVREAYTSVTNAQSEKARTIQEARRAYNQTLGETAGIAHTDLLTMIRAYEWSLAGENDNLTKQLRSVLDNAYRQLRLPSKELLGAIRNYQQSAATAAGGDNPQDKQKANEAAATLTQMFNGPQSMFNGAEITGEIAVAINNANDLRFNIANKAQQDYNAFASDLKAYRETPRLLAATRVQETREKVLADVLVQTIIGRITRIETNPDPEVQEEIAEADLFRRQEEARLKKEAEERNR